MTKPLNQAMPDKGFRMVQSMVMVFYAVYGYRWPCSRRGSSCSPGDLSTAMIYYLLLWDNGKDRRLVDEDISLLTEGYMWKNKIIINTYRNNHLR